MAVPAIQAWHPTLEEERAFCATDATLHWLCNLSADLLRQYGGKWVAAKDCKVVACAPSLDDLLAELGDTDLQTLIIDRIERPAWVVYR